MLKEIFKKVGKAFVNLCLAFIMLIGLFYLRFYETKPFYASKKDYLK
ncbi:MAG: hypothetical protein Q4Q22_02855 [Methanosphaera sp.]|nr:hypothetical protein [Methanosphaera sp.]